MARVASQIDQLSIKFNHEIINKLSEVVETEKIEGVEIDNSELASMEEMMREASQEPSPRTHLHRNTSVLTDAAPITRNSLAVLTGDENDLLSESPVFAKAKPGNAERSASDLLNLKVQPIEVDE